MKNFDKTIDQISTTITGLVIALAVILLVNNIVACSTVDCVKISQELEAVGALSVDDVFTGMHAEKIKTVCNFN